MSKTYLLDGPRQGPCSICRSRLEVVRSTGSKSSHVVHTIKRRCLTGDATRPEVEDGVGGHYSCSSLPHSLKEVESRPSKELATGLLHLLDRLIGGQCEEDLTCPRAKTRLVRYRFRIDGSITKLEAWWLDRLNLIWYPATWVFDSSSGKSTLEPLENRPAKGWDPLYRVDTPVIEDLSLEEVLAQALPFCRAVLEVLLDFDVEKISEIVARSDSFVRFFRSAASWPSDDFVKNAKFFTAAPMAAFLHNELPPAPERSYGYDGSLGSALLFKGALKRYLKNRIVGRHRRDVPLFLGLLQGVKRGCAPVPSRFVYGAYVKHAKALTKDFVREDMHLFEMAPYFERAWTGVRRPSRYMEGEPSSSAALNQPRSLGGARAQIIEEEMGGSHTQQEFLTNMVEVSPGQVVEIRGPVESEEASTILFSILSGGVKREVQVHAVIEPLKARLITKGPALQMWYSRRLQRVMWNHLQEKRQFVLTGRPLEVDDLRWIHRQTLALGLKTFTKFVSGDYSAATDNLKIPYTKLSNETVMRLANCSEKEKEVFRSVLYEQMIRYPSSVYDSQSDEVKESVRDHFKSSQEPFQPEGSPFQFRKFGKAFEAFVWQRSGQLMGSVLSFPHLCVCNLVAYWSALEMHTGRRLELEELPVLINGDDILFMTDDAFYAVWKSQVSRFGFELSLGKNYVHEHFLMINSEAYWFDGEFSPIGYLNVGLLTGQSKLSGRLELRVTPIWDYYNWVLAGACDRLRAHVRFLELNREGIRESTQRGTYNLFLDQRFGGLGFDLYPEVRDTVSFTRFQRQFGHFLRQRVTKFEGDLAHLRPLQGVVADRKPESLAVPIPHHGRYELRPFINVGTQSAPVWQLVIDEEERLGAPRSTRPALLSEFRPFGKDEGRVNLISVHPDRRVLSAFRHCDEKLFTSIDSLLQRPRAYVERPPTPSLD